MDELNRLVFREVPAYIDVSKPTLQGWITLGKFMKPDGYIRRSESPQRYGRFWYKDTVDFWMKNYRPIKGMRVPVVTECKFDHSVPTISLVDKLSKAMGMTPDLPVTENRPAPRDDLSY